MNLYPFEMAEEKLCGKHSLCDWEVTAGTKNAKESFWMGCPAGWIKYHRAPRLP